MLKIKRSNQTDSTTIIMRSMIVLVVVITLLSGVLTVVAIGHELLETSNINSNRIINSLKKTVIDGDNDWQNWRKNSTLDTSSTYVHVYNFRKDARTKNYFSPNTYELLASNPRKIPLLKGVIYSKRFGLLYYSSGHAKGIDYELWVDLESQLNLLERIILVTFIVLILILLISPMYIRIIVKRLMAPLIGLTDKIQNISQDQNEHAVRLDVPERPTEVTNLTKSFNELLEQLDLKSQKEKTFMLNAAHELRTPIATIRSHAQLIRRRGKGHPEIISKSINYIDEETYQMQFLVDQLLLYARSENQSIQIKEYNLTESVDKFVNKFSKSISQTISLNLDSHVLVSADEDNVNQILKNLLSNASKYSADDSNILVTIKKEDSHVALEVTDHGTGIEKKDQDHIFERFYRGGKVRGNIPGTGLGLAISEKLAELNHITLNLKKSGTNGTTFVIIFNEIS